MTTEEITALSERAAAGTLTPEEKLLLLKELNVTLEGVRDGLAALKTAEASFDQAG